MYVNKIQDTKTHTEEWHNEEVINFSSDWSVFIAICWYGMSNIIAKWKFHKNYEIEPMCTKGKRQSFHQWNYFRSMITNLQLSQRTNIRGKRARNDAVRERQQLFIVPFVSHTLIIFTFICKHFRNNFASTSRYEKNKKQKRKKRKNEEMIFL